MSIKQQYNKAYRITRIIFKHNPAPTPDNFFASWVFWGISSDVGIAALKSFDYSLDK